MNIKKLYSLIGAVFALATLTNCSSDELMSEMPQDSMLKITAEIEAQSRSVNYSTSFSNYDKIGIFVSTGKGADCKEVASIYATYRNGAWTLSRDFDLGDYPQGLNLMAYYPYDDVSAKLDAANGTLVFSSIKEGTDLLTTTQVTASVNNSHVVLNFKHMLSLITLNISKGSAYTGKGYISDIWIEGTMPRLYYDDKLICDGNSAWLEKGEGNLSSLKYGISTSTTIGSKPYTLVTMAFPKQADDQPKVVVTADGKDFQFQLPVQTFVSGRNNVYNLIIDEYLTNVPEKMYFGDYEATYLGINSGGKPLYWADRNVGAASVEAAGSYFSWGSVVPGTNFTTAGFNGSTSTGSISGTDKDAAREAMKYGWRIPTRTEMEQLIYLEREKTQVGGVTGWTFYGKNGNKIFLPCAGCYFDDHCFSFGESGYYWTADAVNSTTANVLNLSWSSVFMLAGWEKAQGCSVRGVISL